MQSHAAYIAQTLYSTNVGCDQSRRACSPDAVLPDNNIRSWPEIFKVRPIFRAFPFLPLLRLSFRQSLVWPEEPINIQNRIAFFHIWLI